MELLPSAVDIERRRRLESARAAWVQQCRWSASHARDLHRRWPGPPFGVTTEVFDAGDSTNVVTGPYRGRHAVVFDYSQVRETVSGHETVSYTVCAQILPAPVPALQVIRRPRSAGVIAAVNSSPGVFGLPNRLRTKSVRTGDQVFDEQYEVRSDDKAFASDVLRTELRQWLIHSDGPSWRLTSQDALTWRLQPWTPETADAALRYLADVLDRVAGTLWPAPPP